MGHDADPLAMIQAEHDLMPVVPILHLTGMAGSSLLFILRSRTGNDRIWSKVSILGGVPLRNQTWVD